MRELSRMVADSYNRNRYSMCRGDTILQQDQMFIESGFERMVQNSIEYIDNMKYKPRILELGCGNGVIYTKELATLGNVVGCDVSENQIACARLNVPSGKFIHKDMMELHLMWRYDIIAMFHSFFNISYEDKPILLGRMKYWLSAYGVILITTYGDKTEIRHKDDFFGAPMTWYHISVSDFEKLVTQAGLCVVEHEWRCDEIGERETHLWALEKV